MAVDSRVLWRCRRGIRELDIAFSRFLESHYAALTPEENAAFERLLLENDLDIYDWLMGRQPPPAEYAGLVALMEARLPYTRE